MRCPFCGHEDTQVKDSRPSEDGGAIRRRRFCANCGQRFTTIERTQLRELTVVKSDGRRVPFDREKLARSIRIALRKRPIQEERIERIVNGIVRQLESSGESDIPSKQIGELVMDTLRSWTRSPMSASPASIGIFARPRTSRTSSAHWVRPLGRLCRPHVRNPKTSRTCGRRWRWRGAASATPGPIRRSAASSSRTAAWSAVRSPRPADGRTPNRRRWTWPVRRTRCDGLRHAGAVLPLGPHAALHRCADRRPAWPAW